MLPGDIQKKVILMAQQVKRADEPRKIVCDECNYLFQPGENIPTDTDGNPLCDLCREYYAGIREEPRNPVNKQGVYDHENGKND